MRTPNRWPGAIRGGQTTVIRLVHDDTNVVEEHEFAPQQEPDVEYLDEGFEYESYSTLTREFYVRRDE